MKKQLTLTSILLLVAVSSLGAGTYFYLEIAGGTIPALRGESQDRGYSGWHEVLSFELGAENEVNIGSVTSGGTASVSTFNEFTVSKRLNQASPALFNYLAEGDVLNSVKLVGTRGSVAVYQAELGLVMLQDIEWSGSDGDDIVNENLVFQFGNGRITYKAQDNTGAVSSTSFAYWDQVTNTGESGVTDGDVDAGGGSEPPTISGTTSKTVARGSSGSFTFSINDTDTDISLITSSATSLNESLIANSSVSISGSGSTRTVYFTANDVVGSATLRLAVNDGTTSQERDVTVHIVEANTAPTLASPAVFEVAAQTPSFLREIVISDLESATDHTLTLEVDSGTLTIATDIPGGLLGSQVSGNGSQRISIDAAIDRINTTLSAHYGLQFTPSSSAQVNLQLFVNDNDPVNNLTYSLTASILPTLTRYEVWEREHFVESDRLAGLSDALANTEGDASVNLIEFAFNLDPNQPDSFAIETNIYPASSLSYLEITFPVRKNAPNLDYIVQRYNAVSNEWQNSGFTAIEVGTPTQLNPEFESTTLRLLDPIEEVKSQLVRLLVQYNED